MVSGVSGTLVQSEWIARERRATRLIRLEHSVPSPFDVLPRPIGEI